MSQKHYEPEYKKKVVKLHLEEGRTLKSLTQEYKIAKSTITNWCKQFTEECRKEALKSPGSETELDLMKENLRLKKELEEKSKEILFLKKVAAFFAKELD